MDKRSTLLGVLLLASAFGLMVFQSFKQAPPPVPEDLPPSEQLADETTPAPQGEDAAPGADEPPSFLRPEPAADEPATPLVPTDQAPALITEKPVPEAQTPTTDDLLSPVDEGEPAPADDPTDRTAEATYYTLSNDLITVSFTSLGGAIDFVALHDYPATKGSDEPYRFNALAKTPALTLGLANRGEPQPFAPVFTVAQQTDQRIVFVHEVAPDVLIERIYELDRSVDRAQPYLIRHETRLRNLSPNNFRVDRLFLNIGTAAPTDADPWGWSLNAAYFDGEDPDFFGKSTFGSKGFLGFFSKPYVDSKTEAAPVVWASVKNQFFTGIFTFDEPAQALYMAPVEFPNLPGMRNEHEGITAAAVFELGTLRASETLTISGDYYAGPKEYTRLAHMEQQQDSIMQFGFFGFISKIMLYGLKGIYSFVANYGVAIILMTIIIRLLFWPLTAKAAKSSKRMQKIQEPLKALREKYKDEPQKLQKETMKLFQRHKINPLAGCLPLVIQIPIFIAFYFMLRSASELRFAEFLWIKDLSMPDTIAHIAGFPINILPLLMGISMFFQMRMMPTPSMDAFQAKLLKLMPFAFLFIAYNFSAGLVLYWTCSNCMSILQQVHTNRMKDEDFEVLPPEDDEDEKPKGPPVRKKPRKKAKR